jgi:hypothetical protein
LCRNPGARLLMPENPDIPHPVSDQAFGDLNIADGYTFPTLEIPMIPMVAWWTATNLLAWFVTRASDDLSAIGNGGIDFADSSDAAGTGRFRMVTPKGCRYRLSWSQGEPVQFMGTFYGTDLDPTNPAAAPAVGLTGAGLMSNAVSYSGNLASTKIVGGTLEWDNQCTPNPENNGSLRPSEINAGHPMASLSLQTNGGVPLANASTGAVIVGAVTFTITSTYALNPRDRSQQVGRVIRAFNYKLMASTTVYPVVISAT